MFIFFHFVRRVQDVLGRVLSAYTKTKVIHDLLMYVKTHKFGASQTQYRQYQKKKWCNTDLK